MLKFNEKCWEKYEENEVEFRVHVVNYFFVVNLITNKLVYLLAW